MHTLLVEVGLRVVAEAAGCVDVVGLAEFLVSLHSIDDLVGVGRRLFTLLMEEGL